MDVDQDPEFIIPDDADEDLDAGCHQRRKRERESE
jgi:hypothetical protein